MFQLTRFSHNTVFSRNQNARYAGTRCIMKMGIRKNSHNLSQGPPNPGFMKEKSTKRGFSKKDSRELNFFSCFRFLLISRRPGTLNWERVVFLPSKNLYRKCVANASPKSKNYCMYLIYLVV